MLSLDLFNTKYERELTEGAVDNLEARRIDDLNEKMQDLLARARTANPEMKSALKREFDKVKEERDSYFKIKEAGIPGNIPVEKIPGKEDLLKGKGRSYYESQKKNFKEIDEGRMAELDAMRQDLERMNERQFYTAYGMSKAAFQQKYRTLLKPAALDESQQLHQGDPIVVTGPNEFEGKTGEIEEFSPSGSFVVVNLYNHGRHSMHLSDITYNEYADQEQDEEDDWYDDEEVDEGFQDFNKVEPYAVCLAGKPVKKFDYYEEARRFHDNWKQKLYREGNKEKADKITLMPLNLDEGARGDAIKQGYQAAVKGLTKQQNPYYKSVNGQTPPEAYDWEAGWEDARDSGKIPQGVAESRIDLDSIPGFRREPAKKQTQYHTDEPQDRIDLDSIPGLNLGGSAKSKTSTRLGGAKSKGLQAPDDTKTRGIYNNFKDRVNQLLKQRGDREIDEQGVAEVKADPTGSWIVYGGSRVMKFKTHGGAKAYAEKHGGKVASSEFYADKIQGIKETQTDYQKRRQRERDIDAGKPVPKQRQPKMTDYQKRRAQDKKDMALGEQLTDDVDTSPVVQAILKRIIVAHKDLLAKFGPEKIMTAAEDVAYNVGDFQDIGSSDVSQFVHQVKQILGAEA